MTKLQMINLSVQLHDEVKAYLNGFNATGDYTLLEVANELNNDLTKVEIEISYL